MWDFEKILKKNSLICFSRNSNLKVLKFNFDNFCYCKLKACSLKTPLRKDILRRICPIELKISEFVVLSKFCMKRRSFPSLAFCRSHASHLTGHHLMCFKLFKNLMLIPASYSSFFSECKKVSSWISSCRGYLFSSKSWHSLAGGRFIQPVSGYNTALGYKRIFSITVSL